MNGRTLKNLAASIRAGKKNSRGSAGARFFLDDAHGYQCKLISIKASSFFFISCERFSDGKKSQGFFGKCEAKPGAYSMFQLEPSKSWFFASTNFGDLEISTNDRSRGPVVRSS